MQAKPSFEAFSSLFPSETGPVAWPRWPIVDFAETDPASI